MLLQQNLPAAEAQHSKRNLDLEGLTLLDGHPPATHPAADKAAAHAAPRTAVVVGVVVVVAVAGRRGTSVKY